MKKLIVISVLLLNAACINAQGNNAKLIDQLRAFEL